MHVCKKLVTKHLRRNISAGDAIPETVLVCTDGTTFTPDLLRAEDIVFDAKLTVEEELLAAGGCTQRKRMNKSAMARLAKKIRNKYEHEGLG